jgi:hypothetical protein
MQRRTFLKGTLAVAAVPSLWSEPDAMWGGPVLDTHLHLRRDPDSCFTHIQGCGVTNAVLLTRAVDEDKAKEEVKRRPNHFVRSVAADPAQPDADQVFRRALSGGAVSIGELKYHLALDSPEMRRVCDIAAEMQVPVMMHIQNFPHFPGELPYNTGSRNAGTFPAAHFARSVSQDYVAKRDTAVQDSGMRSRSGPLADSHQRSGCLRLAGFDNDGF